MIDSKQFDIMRSEVKQYDEKREVLIKTCRDILKLSKSVIYAVHRNEFETAKEKISQVQSILQDLGTEIKATPKLRYEGSYSSAVQEYVEAVLYYNYIANQTLLTTKELKVHVDHYILGLCDLSGELTRKAIHYATQDKYEEVLPIREFVEKLYQELLSFDIRRGEMRKKFDQIKYDLRRLDDMAFQLKVNGKL
jgi:predicted translin family RNA/ssDNA-binding protein